MPPTLILLFNHDLTMEQATSARATLGVGRIIPPPEDIRNLWRQIPADQPDIDAYLTPVRKWVCLMTLPADYILIQGDFGATWLMVQFALNRGMIPVYATTRREALETRLPDGTTQLTHHFRHVMFRKYGD